MAASGREEVGTSSGVATAYEPTPLVSSVTAWSGVVLVVGAHIAALVFVTPETDLFVLAAGEATLLAVVAGVEVGLGRGSSRTVGVLAVAWIGLVGTTLLLGDDESLLFVACGLVGTVALALYGIHRYELVTLGLVEVADERE